MECGVDEIGYKFNQRGEDKSTIRDGRVRDLKSGNVQDLIVIEKKIEIDRTGALGNKNCFP